MAARVYRPPGSPKAAVVIAHGLYSSMQSEKLSRLGLALREAGYLVLMFDHSGCGDSPGSIERTTVSSRVSEFLAAAAALIKMGPDSPLIYFGSSLGGSAAILVGAQNTPACTVCWSSPTDFQALARRHEAMASDLPDFGPDLANHDLKSVLTRTGRVLFVHGECDETVPVSQARLGYDLALSPKDLFIIPGADHRLSRLEDQERAIDRTLFWMEQMTE